MHKHQAVREVPAGEERLQIVIRLFESLAMQSGAGSPSWWLRQLGGKAFPGVADWRVFHVSNDAVFVMPGTGPVAQARADPIELSDQGVGLLVSLLSAAWMLRVSRSRAHYRTILRALCSFAVGHPEYKAIVGIVFDIGSRFGGDAKWAVQMLGGQLAVAAVKLASTRPPEAVPEAVS